MSPDPVWNAGPGQGEADREVSVSDVMVEVSPGDFRAIRAVVEKGGDVAEVLVEPGEWWLLSGGDIGMMLGALRKVAVQPDQSIKMDRRRVLAYPPAEA